MDEKMSVAQTYILFEILSTFI